MLEISFTLEGDVEMARRIRNIDTKMNNFKPEFQESADFLKTFFEGQVFDTRGAVIGEPWKPTGYKWPILERSGRMRRSFKTASYPLRGEVFNAVDYFKYHQSKTARRTRLPRRVMMKLTEQLKSKIIQIFHKGINKRIKETK